MTIPIVVSASAMASGTFPIGLLERVSELDNFITVQWAKFVF